MTATETTTAPPPKYRDSRLRRVLAFARNTWRGLTSMRTALILLFLLALAAMPGTLLPQRPLNPPKTDQYIASHGWWGTLLDRLQFFNVYSSVWFSAIYLLLMVSLVGCLLPRTLEYYRSMRAKPVLTPRRLSRMPHFEQARLDRSSDEVFAAARARLKYWRTVERDEEDGTRSISAERGYLRETGNLLFHFSLLGLIVFFALGKLYSYEGQVIVQADGSEFCNSGILNYDSFTPGLRVDGTDLDPFCIKVNDMYAEYTAANEPIAYRSHIQYQSGADLQNNVWQPYLLEVNSPLRTAGDRVYLLGYGYSPTFTVTWPNGQKRSQTIQWATTDTTTELGEGATKFDPPGITDPMVRRTKELAVTGLLAPTPQVQNGILTSIAPELNHPMVAVDVMQGDLGLDSGQTQSIFSIDQTMVDDGRLKRVARENLAEGQSITLADGTKISFDGVQKWVSLQVSHDPTQVYVLVCAISMLVGLGASLLIKRRRVWIRVTPADGGGDGTVLQVGGLARTDQAGYGEEFNRIANELISGEKRKK
ncbi:MAG TPA: cytochrome c biogenesis protein ResB [Amycolatopsis sp.]|nr:cytochrome c biogenesis protein ResB [Amycolatopsis sp.]